MFKPVLVYTHTGQVIQDDKAAPNNPPPCPDLLFVAEVMVIGSWVSGEKKQEYTVAACFQFL